MSNVEFFPVGNKSVEIRFKCDQCHQEVLSEEIKIPSPNYEADRSSESYNDNEGFAICNKCGKEFVIWVYAGYSDGFIDVQNISDEDIFEIIENRDESDEYYEEQIEAILSTPYYDFIFFSE